MTTGLFFTQLLNGLQFGVLLFLLAAGLTLVFGIMNFVNLAHGSLYMMGAYFAAAGFNAFDGSFLAAALAAMPGTLLLGAAAGAPRAAPPVPARPPRPGAGHLRPDPVLQRSGAHRLGRRVGVHERADAGWSGTVDLFGLPYPSYRFAIIAVGLVVGAGPVRG